MLLRRLSSTSRSADLDCRPSASHCIYSLCPPGIKQPCAQRGQGCISPCICPLMLLKKKKKNRVSLINLAWRYFVTVSVGDGLAKSWENKQQSILYGPQNEMKVREYNYPFCGPKNSDFSKTGRTNHCCTACWLFGPKRLDSVRQK